MTNEDQNFVQRFIKRKRKSFISLYLCHGFVSAETENLAISLNTSCIATSELFHPHVCSNAYDGSIESGYGHEWVTLGKYVGEYIKVNRNYN